MKIDDNLSEIFDVAIVPEHDAIKPDGTVIPPDNHEEENDFQKVRQSMHTMMEYGVKAADLAYSVAVSTEDPKAIGALSDLIKNMTAANMTLIDIHEKHARIKPKEPDGGSGQITKNQQNNIFLGTTADLSKFIKGLNEQ